MLLRARDNNIQSFAYIWFCKGNQNDFLKHPKINIIIINIINNIIIITRNNVIIKL